ncbi:MAG TPA: ABC transporter substrate-binding protein, partial [Chloroflexota bacterium]
MAASLLAACGGQLPAASSPQPSASTAAAVKASVPASAAVGLTKMSVVYSALSPSYLALWAAKDGGLFQQNGLDVDMQLTGGGSPAMAVFLSGQADIFQAAGSDLLGAVAGGSDIVVTATTSAVYPFKIEVHPSIKTPADLKGKKIG